MVYFVQAVDGGHIKIGTTIRLSERLKALAKDAGKELRVLAVVQGSYEEEKTLHRRFAHLNVVDEFFEPGDDLLGFIVESGQPWDGEDEGRKYGSAKLDVEALAVAKKVAGLKGATLSDYLSDLVMSVVPQELESEAMKPERKDEPVRIDSEVLRIARIVASYQAKSLSDYISDALRPIVEKDHAKEIKRYSGKGE